MGPSSDDCRLFTLDNYYCIIKSQQSTVREREIERKGERGGGQRESEVERGGRETQRDKEIEIEKES